MQKYSLVIERSPTGLGPGAKELKPIAAEDRTAAHREAHAEADHITAAGTRWVRITVMSPDGTEIAEVRRTALL
jgi:hypothetical protein